MKLSEVYPLVCILHIFFKPLVIFPFNCYFFPLILQKIGKGMTHNVLFHRILILPEMLCTLICTCPSPSVCTTYYHSQGIPIDNMQKNWIFILVALLAPTFSSYGQEKDWTLQACIQYALENNIQLKVNQLNINSSQEALTLAEHARYPSLNGFMSHNYNWGRSFDVFTNAPVTERVQSNSIGLNASATLYSGFALKNTITQRQLELESSKYTVESAKNDMVLSVASAYLQILFSRENLSNAELQVASLNTQIERTQQLVDAGVLPESNLLDLQSQQATNELQVVNSTNTLNLSILQLKQLLQLPPNTEFKIAVPNLAAPSTAAIIPSSQEVYGTAETIMPQIQSADIQIKSTQLGIDIAKASYQPSLSLNASINTFYSSAQREFFLGYSGTRQQVIGAVEIPDIPGFPSLPSLPVTTLAPDPNSEPIVGEFGFFDQLDESLRQSIGLSLNIPIYNRNQVKSSVARAQIANEQARLNAQAERNALRQTIEQAQQDALAAAKTYQANNKQVKALEETYRTTQERFNLGVTNITDFTVAQNNLNVAKANLIRAKYDFIFKREILDFYMGKEIDLK